MTNSSTSQGDAAAQVVEIDVVASLRLFRMQLLVQPMMAAMNIYWRSLSSAGRDDPETAALSEVAARMLDELWANHRSPNPVAEVVRAIDFVANAGIEKRKNAMLGLWSTLLFELDEPSNLLRGVTFDLSPSGPGVVLPDDWLPGLEGVLASWKNNGESWTATEKSKDELLNVLLVGLGLEKAQVRTTKDRDVMKGRNRKRRHAAAESVRAFSVSALAEAAQHPEFQRTVREVVVPTIFKTGPV